MTVRRLATWQHTCQPAVMPVETPLMQAIEMAVIERSIKVPGLSAAVLGIRGCVLGVDTYMLMDLDEHEHQRRRAIGLTTICDRDVLRLLSRLPHGETVSA